MYTCTLFCKFTRDQYILLVKDPLYAFVSEFFERLRVHKDPLWFFYRHPIVNGGNVFQSCRKNTVLLFIPFCKAMFWMNRVFDGRHYYG